MSNAKKNTLASYPKIMDLLDLNSPDPDDYRQSQFEADDELDIAERFRVRVVSQREQLEKAKMFYRHRQDTTKAAVLASDAANLYLEQLQSGWGAPIASVGPATLYEFGLTIPDYRTCLQFNEKSFLLA